LADGREGTQQIEAQFTAKVRRRSQWLTRINFNHPFQVKGVPGWGFEVEEAWLDFADTENPAGFRFPQNYAFDTTLYNPSGADLSDEDASLYWKGFYLKRQSEGIRELTSGSIRLLTKKQHSTESLETFLISFTTF
jgi:hypothetical protein